jgi:TRAP-type C4-dicarboxylate transport system substrate-binding protein
MALVLTVMGCTVDRAGGTAADEVTVLTFAQPNDSAPPPQLSAWADEVARLTDGSVEISFENGWRMGETDYEAGTLHDVRNGKVDLAWVGARAFDGLDVTSFQALLAPMLVDSHELQQAVFDEGIPQEMLAGVEDLGLVGVGVLPGPMRKVLGVSGPFVEPRDFEGAVVGMQGAALVEDTFEALGATAKPVPSGVALDGLDAYEQQLDSIAGNGYQDQAKALTSDLNLWPRPLVIVAGDSVSDTLSDEQQQALSEAARSAVKDALTGARALDEESAAILCETSLKLHTLGEDGLAAFRETLDPVYSSLREDPTTKGFLDRIEALKESVDAEPDAMDCGGEDQASGAIPNGTYQHTVTLADLKEYCGPDYQDPDGPFPGITEDGSTLQAYVEGERIVVSIFPAGQPKLAVIGWSGTYRVYRDTLELKETGLSEGLPLTWSYAGNQLRLTGWTGEECEGEIVWTANPWAKVDGGKP